MLIRPDSVLNTLAVPALATVNWSPAAGVPVMCDLDALEADRVAVAEGAGGDHRARAVGDLILRRAGESDRCRCPEPRRSDRDRARADRGRCRCWRHAAAVVNVPLPAGMFMKTAAPVSPAEMR